MSIQTIIDKFYQIRDLDMRDFDAQKAIDLTTSLGDEIGNAAKSAEKIVLERMPEKDFVLLMLAIQKATSAAAAAHGEGTSLLMGEISGELQSYTQTVILAAIGCLIQDEIL